MNHSTANFTLKQKLISIIATSLIIQDTPHFLFLLIMGSVIIHVQTVMVGTELTVRVGQLLLHHCLQTDQASIV